MNPTDRFRFALANLMQHKVRSLLSLLGVSLGALLLFSSIAGGLGVLDAVTGRLSAGDRLLQISVYSGVKRDRVTAEVARKAGIQQSMSDERRVRLAEAMGVGRARPVVLTLESIGELLEIEHVQDAWGDLRFGVSACLADANARDGDEEWTFAMVQALPPHGLNVDSILVAGEYVPSDQHVLVSELFLYQLGYRTEDQVQSAIGSAIQFSPREPVVESLSSVVRELRRSPEKRISLPNGQPILFPEAQEQLALARQNIKLQSNPLLVSGVFRHPSEKEIRSDPVAARAVGRHVLVPYSQAVDYLEKTDETKKKINGFVRSKSPEHTKRVEEDLAELGYQTQSVAELARQIRTAVLLITAIISVIATGALFISAIGTTNTMVMNVLERQREIAIMKAVGARDRDISQVFLLEGFLIGAFGGALGLVLGLVFAKLCGELIRTAIEKRLNEPLGGSVFAYPVWLIVGTPCLASIVTTFASYVPARRAARLDPARTLREL